MRAGRLRRQIKLQSKSTSVTRDSEGGRVDSWSTDATVFARREDIGGDESFEADSDFAVRRTRWTVRHTTHAQTASRIVEAESTGTVYDILRVSDPTGRKRELEIMAVERGA